MDLCYFLIFVSVLTFIILSFYKFWVIFAFSASCDSGECTKVHVLLLSVLEILAQLDQWHGLSLVEDL